METGETWLGMDSFGEGFQVISSRKALTRMEMAWKVFIAVPLFSSSQLPEAKFQISLVGTVKFLNGKINSGNLL